MRRDENVLNAIMLDRRKENATGCCVRNDGSGCVQTQRQHCSVSSFGTICTIVVVVVVVVVVDL